MSTTTVVHGRDLRVEVVESRYAACLTFRGEATVENIHELTGAFDVVETLGTSALRLDVSRLAFADVAALCRLTHFATTMRDTDRTVVTVGAQPIVDRLASVLGFRDRLGIS